MALYGKIPQNFLRDFLLYNVIFLSSLLIISKLTKQWQANLEFTNMVNQNLLQ
jgi:hypothetical protein